MAIPLDNDESPETPAPAGATADDAPETDVSAESAAEASAAQADLSAEAPAAQADPLVDLLREKDALQDRLLRTAAEFDNYRKRTDRERRDQANTLMADAIEELLPIIDDLERALEAPVGTDGGVLRAGVELIHRQMTELLLRRGVKPIEAVGTDFDPHFHQAMAHEASPAHREGEVMEELRKGYTLGNRLLRPAMVKVAKA
jgi:molecular chaperone GrpE